MANNNNNSGRSRKRGSGANPEGNNANLTQNDQQSQGGGSSETTTASGATSVGTGGGRGAAGGGGRGAGRGAGGGGRGAGRGGGGGGGKSSSAPAPAPAPAPASQTTATTSAAGGIAGGGSARGKRNRGNRGGGNGGNAQSAPPPVATVVSTVPIASSMIRDMKALESIANTTVSKVDGVRRIGVARAGFEVEAANKESLDKACILLEDMLDRQARAQSRLSVRQRLENDIARVQKDIAEGLRVEFSIPSECIALVLGARGENVRRVTNAYGLERVVVDKDMCAVRIIGNTAESVASARGELEYAAVEVPLSKERIGYVVGKGGANIKDLYERSGAHSIKILEGRGVMRIVGLKRACEACSLLVTSQLDHLSSMEDETKTIEVLRRQLEEMAADWGESASDRPRGGGARRAPTRPPPPAAVATVEVPAAQVQAQAQPQRARRGRGGRGGGAQ